MESYTAKCSDCGKPFQKKYLYNKHRQTHDRPYPCAICGKAFSLKTGLKRHRETHRSSRASYECPYSQCSLRRTLSQNYLLAHLREYHGVDEDPQHIRTLTFDNQLSLVEKQRLLKDEQDLRFLECVSRGDKIEVEHFLTEDAGARVSAKDSAGSTALHLALKKGHDAIVETLLQSGVDVNKADNYNNTALSLMFWEKRYEIVKKLIDSGADPNVVSLQDAAKQGQYEGIEHLIHCGVDITKSDSDGDTTLHIAAVGGDESFVKILIRNKADFHATNHLGYTPFHYAAIQGHVGVTIQLLASGANFDTLSNSGSSPLNLASFWGHIVVVKLLLDSGADVNLTDLSGSTPLRSASQRCEIDIIRLLLKANAQVHPKTSTGDTPLSRSIIWGSLYSERHVKSVKLLLAAGAEFSLKDWYRISQYYKEIFANYCPAGAKWSPDADSTTIPWSAESDPEYADVLRPRTHDKCP
ncbi:ankyrin repeat-containing domain protein [Rhexocercosporidium sp. MPI-PUGE-AT-0058]|nr:ankyrin repeat-containing domain protein [Rhexocercosporidium sp. MPI-PUGE-AT-0058]